MLQWMSMRISSAIFRTSVACLLLLQWSVMYAHCLTFVGQTPSTTLICTIDGPVAVGVDQDRPASEMDPQVAGVCPVCASFSLIEPQTPATVATPIAYAAQVLTISPAGRPVAPARAPPLQPRAPPILA